MMETTHPVADWRYEVANGDTFRGYDEWREFRIEAEGEPTISTTQHPKGRDCARTDEVLENYRHRAIVAEAALAAIPDGVTEDEA